jgi:hypothetical protein
MDAVICQINSRPQVALKSAKGLRRGDFMELCSYTRGKKKGTINLAKERRLHEVISLWNCFMVCGNCDWSYCSQDDITFKQKNMDAMLRMGFAKFIRSFNLNKGITEQFRVLGPQITASIANSLYC